MAIDLRYTKRNPQDGVSMEISSWIEPQVELLLSFPFALCADVRTPGYII